MKGNSDRNYPVQCLFTRQRIIGSASLKKKLKNKTVVDNLLVPRSVSPSKSSKIPDESLRDGNICC